MEALIGAIIITWAIRHFVERGKAEYGHTRDRAATELARAHPHRSPRWVARHARRAARGYWWDQIRNGFPDLRLAHQEARELAAVERHEAELSFLERRAEIRRRIDAAMRKKDELRREEREPREPDRERPTGRDELPGCVDCGARAGQPHRPDCPILQADRARRSDGGPVPPPPPAGPDSTEPAPAATTPEPASPEPKAEASPASDRECPVPDEPVYGADPAEEHDTEPAPDPAEPGTRGEPQDNTKEEDDTDDTDDTTDPGPVDATGEHPAAGEAEGEGGRVIPFTGGGPSSSPTTPTKENDMTASGETTSLTSAIAYAETMASTTEEGVTSTETSISSLQNGGVGGEAINQLTQAMENLSSAAASFRAAQTELQAHVSVQDAYGANPDAGDKEFVTAD